MGGLGSGLLGRLANLFRGGRGGQTATKDSGIYIRVKCNACDEVVQARINPTSELSRSDDDASYFVRKVLVGKQCFRPIEVEIHYADMHGKEISREVRGGTSVE